MYQDHLKTIERNREKIVLALCIIVIILITSSCSILSPKENLLGYYVSSHEGYNSQGKDLFYFKEDSFKLIRITDTKDGFGLGSYTIEEDSITLSFVDYTKEKTFTIETRDSSHNDSIIFEIQVEDIQGKYGIAGVSVLFKNSEESIVTNENGFGKIKMLKSEMLQDTLITSYVGYSNESIPIDPELGNYQTIKIKLRSGYYYFEEGDTLKYKFELENNGFSLNIYDYGVDFRPTSRRRFKKALDQFNEMTMNEF